MTIYNGSKNKYCDGQRDSSVHGCRLLKAAAVIILLQATCDTGIVVISLYSVLEFYRTCHRITKLFSISSHKTLILLHFFWLPSYDLKYSALPYLFMPPISVCQLVKLWFVAHRTFLGIKNQTKTKKVIHIHIYLYKYLSISNAIFWRWKLSHWLNRLGAYFNSCCLLVCQQKYVKEICHVVVESLKGSQMQLSIYFAVKF